MTGQDLASNKIPDAPGVYFFKQGKRILYIGKATSLRNRIRSYFGKDLIATRGPLLVDMITKATAVSYTVAHSVLEALVNEAALIKKHQPYYNTKEKDDKSHYYVCITDERHPLVILERGKNIDFNRSKTSRYTCKYLFGPFPNGNQIRDGLRLLRKIFPFDDASSLQKGQRHFYRQLGLAPVSHDAAYRKSIKKLALFLGGKSNTLTRQLEREMRQYAQREQFEQAAESRNQLFALRHINDVALMKRESSTTGVDGQDTSFRIEAYDVAHSSGTAMVGAMVVIENGEAKKGHYRKFTIRTVRQAHDPAALSEIIIRRCKHAEWQRPQLIVVDGNRIQYRAAQKALNKNQWDIPIVAVTKDHRHKPKSLYGDATAIQKHRDAILLANAEAHRYVLSFHRHKRGKKFLGK